MEPNTVRLSQETWNDLDDEADEYDFDNRSAYLRWLVDNREIILAAADPSPSNGPAIETDVATSDDVADLREDVRRLEECLDNLKSRDVNVDDSDPPARAPDSGDVDAAIDAALADWTPKTKRDARQEAGHAALAYLRREGRATKADFVSELRPEYDVEDQNDDTYWKKTVRPALQAAKDQGIVFWERGPPHEYVWNGVDDSEPAQ